MSDTQEALDKAQEYAYQLVTAAFIDQEEDDNSLYANLIGHLFDNEGPYVWANITAILVEELLEAYETRENWQQAIRESEGYEAT